LSFFSAFNANFFAERLHGFFSVKKKTPQTVIRFRVVVFISMFLFSQPRFPLHRSEISEDVPVRVQNHNQNVCMTVISAVKFSRFETIVTARPQKFEMVAEICESL
jgi:hypothetical protein